MIAMASYQAQWRSNKSKCLFVSGKGGCSPLPDDMDLFQLREMFAEFEDQIRGTVIVSSPTLQRVGKVTFKSVPAAASALHIKEQKLSGISIRYWREKDNVKLPVKMPNSSGARAAARECRDDPDTDRTARTLYIKIHDCKGPDVYITNSDLRSHFQDFAKDIQSVNVIFEPGTDIPRGYAFATFKTKNAASRAIEYLQGTRLNDRHKLVLSFKTRKGTSNPQQAPQPKPQQHIITLELKDDVVGMMLMESEGVVSDLKALATEEGVELSSLPASRYGFQMKGGANGCRVVNEQFDLYRQAIEQKLVGYAQIVLSAPYEGICSSSEILGYRDTLRKDLKVVTACSFERAVVNSTCLCVGKSHVALIKVVVGNLNTERVDAVVIPTDRADSAGHYPVEMTSLNGTFTYLYNSGELAEIGDTATVDGGSLSCSYIIQALLPLSVPDDFSCDIVVKKCLAHASKMQLGSIAFPGIRTQMVQSLVDGLSSMVSTTLHTVSIVLDNHAEADGFAKALNDLVSCSNKEQAEEMVAGATQPATPVLTAPNLGGSVWLWKDNDGLFKPYSPVDTTVLNTAYNSDPGSICTLKINGTSYEVNFKLMKQVNLKTNFKRDVRNSSGQDATWKYRDDFGRFMSYSSTDSAKIEAMFQAKDTSQHLVILGRSYEFDFAQMKQVNVETRHPRDIKHELPGGDVVKSKSVVAVPTCKTFKFLCHNEIVVNLKGPSKTVRTARMQLDQKLKPLLGSKTTSYPPKATLALLSKLKDTARKRLVTCTVESSSESGASSVSKCLKLEGLNSSVLETLPEIQQVILDFQLSLDQLPEEVSSYPPEWDHMSKEEQLKIVDLTARSPEYRAVCSKFQETLSNHHIFRVQRVQNKLLWDRYVHTKCRLHKKNAGMINEKELFHGTRDKPAKTICSSEEGFDMRFSRQGMWGQANYFAVKASYSDSYSYHDTDNETNEIILAKVLTGDSYSCEPDSSLRMPPEKNQSSLASGAGQIQQVRYDSVTGHTHGSQVFMTYNNDRAYPAYIITYSKMYSAVAAGIPFSGYQPVPRATPRATAAAPSQPLHRASSYVTSPPSQPLHRASSYVTSPPSQPLHRASSYVTSPPSQPLHRASSYVTSPPSQLSPPQPSPPQRSYSSTTPLASRSANRSAQSPSNAKDKSMSSCVIS